MLRLWAAAMLADVERWLERNAAAPPQSMPPHRVAGTLRIANDFRLLWENVTVLLDSIIVFRSPHFAYV